MRLIAVAVVGLLVGSVASSQEDWRRALESTQLDLREARSVADLTLAIPRASLVLEQGTLIPANTVGDHPREFVFVGAARLEMEPPNELEARQLELFTGSRSLREPITKAVLVVGRDVVAEALLRRPLETEVDPTITRAAADLFDEWRASGERELLQVEQIQLVDLLGDPAGEYYFAGWLEGANHGRFMYVYDPWEFEQISIGQFEPAELTAREERRLSRRIQREQRRKGRFIGLDISELGIWNSWISVAQETADGRTLNGSTGFEAQHFVLEVDIASRDLELNATARIVLKAENGASTVIPMDLSRDLEVESVLDAAGRPLYFDQHDERLLVVLPVAPSPGDSIVVECRIRGRIFDSQDLARVLRTTTRWYPKPGGPNDRATFDVKIRWPKRFDLVASGQMIDSGIETETRFGRWQLSKPAKFFSFEFGRFEVYETKAGDTRITLALDPLTRREIRRDADDLLDTASDALQYFEKIFGPYPFSDLTIVTLPRGYSQAVPGLVTLARGEAFDAVADTDIEENYVLAHEIAHQWWGHVVSWQSYRDQWISEAMANYAAVLFVRNQQSGSRRLPTSRWKSYLLAETRDGRQIESLGPLVLGERLNSSYSTSAYFAIVYMKGAMVLDMLARAFGEENFLKVLHALIEAVGGQSISTEDFLTLVEHITDVPMTTFGRQFIYNTGVPKVYYDLEVEAAGDGQWRIHGEANQQATCRLEYQLEKLEDGRIDLAYQCVHQVDVDRAALIVPIQAMVYDPERRGGADDPERTGNRVIQFHTLLSGPSTEIDFRVPLEPKQVWLDARSEVLGEFFSRRRNPKSVLYYRAVDLADAGRWEEAELQLREALVANVGGGSFSDQELDKKEIEKRRIWLDTLIYWELLRIHLARHRLESAVEAKEAADTLWRKLERRHYSFRAIKPRTALILEARLELLKGNARAALRTLDLDTRESSSREWQLAYALTTCALGRRADFEAAVEQAEERGADVSLLDNCF